MWRKFQNFQGKLEIVNDLAEFAVKNMHFVFLLLIW